jgi:Tfp pilus assembly protein PilN
MALRLNLYHEVQKQKQLERRDPLKLSMFGLGAVAICLAAIFAVQFGKSHSISSELTRVKAEFDKLEPEAKAAKLREEEIGEQVKLNERLAKRIEERFYWAPVLEQVAQVVPREVQIMKLSGDVTGEGLRKCTVIIEGLSAGSDARGVAEELRTALAEKLGEKYRDVTSNFKSLEDGAESVAIDGKQVQTAVFSINVGLTTGEEAAPATPNRRKKI